jgi:hypothetical protein
MEGCRNCDAPLNGSRFCPECGADSKAKKFDRSNDVIEENKKLKQRIADLEKEKTPPAPPKTGADIE